MCCVRCSVGSAGAPLAVTLPERQAAPSLPVKGEQVLIGGPLASEWRPLGMNEGSSACVRVCQHPAEQTQGEDGSPRVRRRREVEPDGSFCRRDG